MRPTGLVAYTITVVTDRSLNADFLYSNIFSPEKIFSTNSGLIDNKTFINFTHFHDL